MSSSRRNVSIMLSLRPRRQRLQCETLSERAPDALGDALHQRLCAALLGAAKPLDQRHGTRSGRAVRASCRAQQIG